MTKLGSHFHPSFPDRPVTVVSIPRCPLLMSMTKTRRPSRYTACDISRARITSLSEGRAPLPQNSNHEAASQISTKHTSLRYLLNMMPEPYCGWMKGYREINVWLLVIGLETFKKSRAGWLGTTENYDLQTDKHRTLRCKLAGPAIQDFPYHIQVYPCSFATSQTPMPTITSALTRYQVIPPRSGVGCTDVNFWQQENIRRDWEWRKLQEA